MKTLTILLTIFICAWYLSVTSAVALRFEFDSEKEIADWELGPDATATVEKGMLQLEVRNGQNSGIYFGSPDWTDYRMEVRVRKLQGPYFHLFIRVVEPIRNFYFMEISYNSHTTSLHRFEAGTGTEITPGGNAARPKRPDAKDTKGGDAYTLVFEAKGDNIKTFIDGKLMIEQKDNTYKTGRLGLGGRDSVVLYEYVDVEGAGIPPSAIDLQGKLTSTWGRLKNQ
ncbi:DUF1080 domain-containing protein [Candidatus Poribacteria bacterium]|nr:DUF1080 domain-containing protein [Candidatus Poribacteria bacterium]